MILAAISIVLIVLILMDAFEALVFPRRVNRKFRLARLFYRSTWILWRACFRREKYMALYGPLSMIGLLTVWALGLICSFGLLSWALQISVHQSGADGPASLLTYLYLSGVTFTTLGLGDVLPLGHIGRFVTVTESAVGFGFLALVIGYLPVLYNHFSSREITISLLDARAGSPPSAAQFFIRMAHSGAMADVDTFLEQWEYWAAQLLESHISFPVLAYYRSQHDNQSWLSALTFMLDSSALMLAGVETARPHQARLTFAMARHAVVDMALVFGVPPIEGKPRLDADGWQRLQKELREAKVTLRPGGGGEAKFAELRNTYEPFVNALSRHFGFRLPEILPATPGFDNWQSSAWTGRVAGMVDLAPRDHFE